MSVPFHRLFIAVAAGPTLCCGAWVSHCSGFSCWWNVLVLGCSGSVVVAHRFSCSEARESSWTRDQTHAPCTGRQILIHCTTREDLEFFKKYFIPLVCWICRYRTHTYGRLSIIRTLSCFLSLREAPHIRCWNHDFIMFCGIYSWVTKERIEDNLKNICKIKTWG